MKQFSILSFLLLLVIISHGQALDTIVMPNNYKPTWKLNSFGFSLRLMEQNYLTDYTIEDAQKNFYNRNQSDFSDSLELFSKTNIKDSHSNKPQGITFNTTWKKEKTDEIRLSFFIHDFRYSTLYTHTWKVGSDTTGNLRASFLESYTLIGFNLQKIKYSPSLLKNHIRAYGGGGVELASDFNTRSNGFFHLTYHEIYSDSLNAVIASNRNLYPAFHYNTIDQFSKGTKMRVYGAINILVGIELSFKKLIKIHREQFSFFAEYGMGLDGEVLVGGSQLVRWSQQGRFGFRYILK